MEHNVIKEQLDAFYDGELGQAVRQEIESHLVICQECHELYQNWAKTAKALFKAPKVETSEFFVRKVMDGIRELEPSKKMNWNQKVSWNISLPWLTPVAGLAAMLLFAPASYLPLTSTLSAETLLISEGSDESSQWMFSKGSPKADEVLGFVLEGSS